LYPGGDAPYFPGDTEPLVIENKNAGLRIAKVPACRFSFVVRREV
jgi:hypothetical protein